MVTLLCYFLRPISFQTRAHLWLHNKDIAPGSISFLIYHFVSLVCIFSSMYFISLVCTKTVCHRDSSFILGTVWALVKNIGTTLNQLSCVSWVNLFRCLLVMSLTFSTFSEDWCLQEQSKWYSTPRDFDIPWVTADLKAEPLLLWRICAAQTWK